MGSEMCIRDSMHATAAITEQYTLEKVVQAENGGKVRLNIHLPRLESDSADAARAEQAILKELADLCTGPITDEEFEDCRRGLLSGMNGVEDSLGGIESWYYIEVLRAGANSAAPIQSPEQARNALRAVTKDEVRDILRRLTLSVSYLLTKEDAAHAAE